jgi:hypothetical protein
MVCVRAHEAISFSLRSDSVMGVLAIFLAAADEQKQGYGRRPSDPCPLTNLLASGTAFRHSHLLSSSLPNLCLSRITQVVLSVASPMGLGEFYSQRQR